MIYEHQGQQHFLVKIRENIASFSWPLDAPRCVLFVSRAHQGVFCYMLHRWSWARAPPARFFTRSTRNQCIDHTMFWDLRPCRINQSRYSWWLMAKRQKHHSHMADAVDFQVYALKPKRHDNLIASHGPMGSIVLIQLTNGSLPIVKTTNFGMFSYTV